MTRERENIVASREVETSSNLWLALDEVHSRYSRGEDALVSAMKVYSSMDDAARVESQATFRDTVRFFGDMARFDDVHLARGPFQLRTDDLKSDGVIVDTFAHFEGKIKRNRMKDLGFFYLHLSGLLTNGDEVTQVGFADRNSNLRDMLNADYIYHRGLRALQIYMYGGFGIDSPAVDVMQRGWNRAATKEERLRIRDGVSDDLKAMEQAIAVSGVFALESWERFTENNPELSEADLSLVKGIEGSYRRRVEKNKEMGRIPDGDLADYNPMLPFTFPQGHEVTLISGLKTAIRNL